MIQAVAPGANTPWATTPRKSDLPKQKPADVWSLRAFDLIEVAVTPARLLEPPPVIGFHSPPSVCSSRQILPASTGSRHPIRSP